MGQQVRIELETAARYRRRAEELRGIAGSYKNSETNRILDAVAADYDRMADSLESEDRTNETIRSLRCG